MRWDVQDRPQLWAEGQRVLASEQNGHDNPGRAACFPLPPMAAGPRLRHGRLQHRRHLESHLDAQPHHVDRAAAGTSRCSNATTPRETNGELFNKKYGIKGGNNTIPGGFTPDEHHRLPGHGHRRQQPRGPRLAEPPADRRPHLDQRQPHHEVRRQRSGSQNNIYNIRSEIGGYTFNGRFTGDGMADFLLGMASDYSWQSRIQVDLRSSNTGMFIQDDWKVIAQPHPQPRLALRTRAAVHRQVRPHGHLRQLHRPDKPRLIYAGSEGSDRYNRAMFATDKNNFMPRVGFAYKLGAKTVVRSGYGVFFNYLEPLGDGEYLIGNPPNAYGISAGFQRDGPGRAAEGRPAPRLARIRQGYRADIRCPMNARRQHRLRATVELQYPARTRAELDGGVGYSGSKGMHLLRALRRQLLARPARATSTTNAHTRAPCSQEPG